jgi:hypothetical protein
MALSLTFDVMPEELTRRAAVHELHIPPVDRRAVAALIERMGLADRQAGFAWERKANWLIAGDARAVVGVNELSGGLRYRLRPVSEEPGSDVRTEESRLEELARNFLDQLARPGEPMTLAKITYLHTQTTSSGGSPRQPARLDAGLIFTRTVDDLPVIGSGGSLMVKIGTDETIVGGREVWRPIARRGASVGLRSAEECVERLRDRVTASGADGEVHVRKAQQAYAELGIEEEQLTLEPCYAFLLETSGGLVDSKKVEVIPATQDSPGTMA